MITLTLKQLIPQKQKLMKLLLLSIILAFTMGLQAQTWSDDVAQIVYNKCSACHNPNGIAPFSLVTYAETAPMATALLDAINQDRMPPWPADNSYLKEVVNISGNSR